MTAATRLIGAFFAAPTDTNRLAERPLGTFAPSIGAERFRGAAIGSWLRDERPSEERKGVRST